MSNVLKLQTLRLRNFKGIKEFELQANGNDIKVYGDNATGKTTLVDAFHWLLFNKDSQGKTDFQIKTVDQDGNEIHNLEHEVEGIFEYNGKPIIFKKVLKEKWVKKRGSASTNFEGHSTDYYIDEVPAKKKEYDEKVYSIIDEDTIKLLTSTTYFNEIMHWKDRRDLLIEIAGDVGEEEVAEAKPELQKLLDILNGRDIEDHRKIINEKRKNINKELERIPIRIDEAEKSKPEVTMSADEIEKALADFDKQINEVDKQLQELEHGNTLIIKENELLEANNELLTLRQDITSEYRTQRREIQEKIMDLEFERNAEQRKRTEVENEINGKELRREHMKQTRDDLREKFKKINAETFEHHEETTCPACGQDLPHSHLEDARTKAEEKWNAEKVQKLKEVREKGHEAKAALEQLTEDINALTIEKENIVAKVNELNGEIEELQEKLNEATQKEQEANDHPDIEKQRKKIANIESQIEQLKDGSKQEKSELEEKKRILRDERRTIERELANHTLIKKTAERIRELEQEQEQLAQEFEQLEEQLYLTDEFIRTKVDMVTERINKFFKHARFKLFRENINGGVEEMCETLYEGVPYSTGLNNAAKINVGLDIANTLQKHFKLQVPIFIDNRESVTKLIETDCQIISLIVSERDKKLRIEED